MFLNIKNKYGFTLIEVLISVVIIGTITSIVFPALNIGKGRGNDAKIEGSLANMRSYSAMYYSQNGTFENFCETQKINSAISASSIFADAVCFDGDKGWALSSLLSNNNYYCADFSGLATTTQTAGISSTDFGCGANTGTSTINYEIVVATSSPLGTNCSGVCNIFLTQSTYPSSFGGKDSADTYCNSDPNKPDSGTYKALVGIDFGGFSGRYADLALGASSDWVLHASTTYYRIDNSTPIFTTNSNGWFSFNVDNPITAEHIGESWTGINSADGTAASGYNCNNWSSSGWESGQYGYSDYSDSGLIQFSSNFCWMMSARLYCVEQ